MKLTIGLLVSNRITKLQKVLDSVKPLLDEGIAELICVDTVTITPGKESDGSAELAAKYATKIIPFEWIKDFSKARNITLENATGEWYMFIDDDEWFEDPMPLVRFFKSGEYKHYKCASYTIRNYKDPEFTTYGDTTAIRLVKRFPDLKFTGRVHENLNHVELPCKELNVIANHDGYVFLTEEERIAHSERNVSVLREELQEAPMDFRLNTQMALELASIDNQRALDFLEEVLKKFEHRKSESTYQWLLSLRFPLYEALEIPSERAEQDFDCIVKTNRLSETALLAMNYSLSRICILSGDMASARKHIREYLRLYNILEKDEKKRFLQDAVDFRKYLSQDKRTELQGFDEEIGLLGTTEEKIKELKDMPFDKFKKAVNTELQKTTNRFESEFFGKVLEYFAANSIVEYCFVLYRMAEEEIKAAVDNGAGGKAIDELMTECILTERKMYESLYRPEMFCEKNFYLLEDNVKYNDILTQFVQNGKKDFRKVLEAAKLRPDMALVMKAWLGAFVK